MKTTGYLKATYRDYQTGKWVLQFEADEAPKSLSDKKLSIEVKEYRRRRSLDQNAYYHTLLSHLSSKLKISNAHCHNMMLRRYSTPQDIAGQLMKVFLPDTEDAWSKASEAETYHLKPTSEFEDDKRCWVMMKGSHEMDTAEMTRLLDGLIDECRQVGIETLTPAELERMRYEAQMELSVR